MVTPKKIVGTNHPYLAFLASLRIAHKQGYLLERIVCPGLGTGVGGISGEESAKQIFQALEEFFEEN
jgi:O-acetyl-ADP-ribose deacetylase (regulator of RNase III)